MNRLESLQWQCKKMWIPYLMPEFPVPNTTVPTLLALQRSGADVIELGFPHSDPLADGRTIQDAAQVAIRNGVTLPKLLEWIYKARTASPEPLQIPLIVMGYINPILQYGIERFLAEAKTVGVDGLIVPDLPPEEAEEFRQKCIAQHLALVFLISPVTSEARIQKIDALATHFLYAISVNATTGTGKLSAQDTSQIRPYLERVRRNAKKPFVVGFGIEAAEQAASILEVADGVVVGSALLRAMSAAKSAAETVALAEAFWKTLCQSHTNRLCLTSSDANRQNAVAYLKPIDHIHASLDQTEGGVTPV
ncbi:MAG: tryptophan synthase subunit alpha [Chloroherpetonaceae bacterium]|nr:tryptophan synthase subunit alpha [Chloroherpetonaceae bacterium]MDW8466209.1 tryptophan synthase subunit alpha [Chloroherpetonaceae bacterium]